MKFAVCPLTREDVQELQTWRYEEPYAIYSLGDGSLEELLGEMLDPRSPYFAVRNDEGELIGFFNIGTSALVWDAGEPGVFLDATRRASALGLGLRPDLTGRGLGQSFAEAALAFLHKQYAPQEVWLYVLAWNERAIRVYERTGFQRVRTFTQENRYGKRDFVEMRRDERSV